MAGLLPTPSHSNADPYEQMMGTGTAVYTPPTPMSGIHEDSGLRRTASQDRRENEKEDREMFSKLEKPRVRYDVEVVTKLIVYSGKSITTYAKRILIVIDRHSVDCG